MGKRQEAEIERLQREIGRLQGELTSARLGKSAYVEVPDGWSLTFAPRWSIDTDWGHIDAEPNDQEWYGDWGPRGFRYRTTHKVGWASFGGHQCNTLDELLAHLNKSAEEMDRDHGDKEKVERERLERIATHREEDRAKKFFPLAFSYLRSISERRERLDSCWDGICSLVRDVNLTKKADEQYVESERVAHLEREARYAAYAAEDWSDE